MFIGPGNGKRRLGQGGVPSADQPGGKINQEPTAPLEVRIELPDFDVDVLGTVELSSNVDASPIGMAVVPVSDTVEVVVMVSARRRRGTS